MADAEERCRLKPECCQESSISARSRGRSSWSTRKAVTRRRNISSSGQRTISSGNVEAPLGIEESVGHQCVEMGMEIDQILTECVNHHDSGGDRFGEPDRAPEILAQALVSDPAEVL